MLKITGSEDYYPTPERLLDEITAGLNWETVRYVLEPSAGRGNICDYVVRKSEEHRTNWHEYDGEGIDCVEIEPDLRAILKEKGYRVVHDDFLTLHTYKHYDLVLMNPPFSVGARHLLKAIEIQETSGGKIICLLNAETLRNPYSNERKALVQKLEHYGAEIKYHEEAFSDAEHPTDVEVASVELTVPAPERETTIFETLREKEYEEYERKRENSELAEADLVGAIVAQYNRELEWGLRLYDEYLELLSKSLDGKSPIVFEIAEGEYSTRSEEFSVNRYVRAVRKKYWDKFFRSPRFMGGLTSNLQKKYLSRVNRFVDYDFSYWNIKTVQEEIARSLVQGVEDCLIGLFDELSHKYSWSEDLELGNIHYYNGWKSNTSWKINRRVVLPLSIYDVHRGLTYSPNLHEAIGKLSDIEKVLNYLDNGETVEAGIREKLSHEVLKWHTKNIHLKYFDVTFYKKGTCHITFTNERLLKKLNIYGSQRKGWLPFGYGRKRSEDMDADEQAVIESFEGREAYNETLMSSDYYLYDARSSVPMLTV